MTTPTTLAAVSQPPVDHEASWFAVQWLRGSRHLAVRTAPVIAVVRELSSILRDEQIPAPQALLAVRRAVRLLGVLTAGTRGDDRGDLECLGLHDRVLDEEDVTGSAESVRFASSWLRGDPAEAIRTEPVIAVIEDLLTSMLDVQTRPSQVYDSLRRAVRVLSVFIREGSSATAQSAA